MKWEELLVVAADDAYWLDDERRRARHSVRCSVCGALGGVLDKSMGGF